MTVPRQAHHLFLAVGRDQHILRLGVEQARDLVFVPR